MRNKITLSVLTLFMVLATNTTYAFNCDAEIFKVLKKADFKKEKYFEPIMNRSRSFREEAIRDGEVHTEYISKNKSDKKLLGLGDRITVLFTPDTPKNQDSIVSNILAYELSAYAEIGGINPTLYRTYKGQRGMFQEYVTLNADLASRTRHGQLMDFVINDVKKYANPRAATSYPNSNDYSNSFKVLKKAKYKESLMELLNSTIEGISTRDIEHYQIPHNAFRRLLDSKTFELSVRKKLSHQEANELISRLKLLTQFMENKKREMSAADNFIKILDDNTGNHYITELVLFAQGEGYLVRSQRKLKNKILLLENQPPHINQLIKKLFKNEYSTSPDKVIDLKDFKSFASRKLSDAEEKLLNSRILHPESFRAMEGTQSVGVNGGTQALWMPISYHNYFNSISKILAYEFDQALMLNSIPTTVIREYNGEIGILQLHRKVRVDSEGAASDVNQKILSYFLNTDYVQNIGGSGFYLPKNVLNFGNSFKGYKSRSRSTAVFPFKADHNYDNKNFNSLLAHAKSLAKSKPFKDYLTTYIGEKRAAHVKDKLDFFVQYATLYKNGHSELEIYRRFLHVENINPAHLNELNLIQRTNSPKKKQLRTLLDKFEDK